MLLRMFPVLPDWNGMHPVFVHFPVALLLVAPLLLIVALAARDAWRPWAFAALALMALGAVSAWLAVGSGHAAGQLVDRTPELERAISAHEALALTTRNLWTLLTLLLALVVLMPAWLRRPLPAGLRITAFLLVVALSAAGASWLARTADTGGRLVHTSGVRAMVEAPRTPDTAAVAAALPH